MQRNVTPNNRGQRLQLLAGLVLAAAVSDRAVLASWSHSQKDATRSNAASAYLPNPDTGVRASSVLLGSTSRGPLYHTTSGAVVATTTCRVTLLSSTFDKAIPWQACTETVGNITSIALYDSADLLVVLAHNPTDSHDTLIMGLSASQEYPAPLFGPLSAGGHVIATEPVVVGNTAYLVATEGYLVMVNLDTHSTPYQAGRVVQLCSAKDEVSQPPVLMATNPAVLFVVTKEGCGTAFDTNGMALWHTSAGLASGDMVHMPPAGDPGSGRALFVTATGQACCMSHSNSSQPCDQWGSFCVQVTSIPAQLPVSGLAVSPDTADFHGGRVYTVGADGTLFAIATQTAEVDSTPQPVATPPIVAPPVLIPNGWGEHNNALLVLSGAHSSYTRPYVVAMSVGSNGGAVDDDDGQDDDGQASTGIVWVVDLPVECGHTLSGGGISVSDAGRVFLPCPSSIVAVDPDHSPQGQVGGPDMEGLVVAGCVVAAVAAVGLVGFVAHKRRALAEMDHVSAFMDAAEATRDSRGTPGQSTGREVRTSSGALLGLGRFMSSRDRADSDIAYVAVIDD